MAPTCSYDEFMERLDNGLFIAIEGIDGAGKTTQVEMLQRFFAAVGDDAVRSKEPTDGPWGQKIRQSAANGRMTWQQETEAFVADRAQHLEQLILPALASGRTVILDRYMYSTIAYQGSHGGDVAELTKVVFDNAPEPDIVFLLDVPAELGMMRVEHGRGDTPNAFEKIEGLRHARQIFNSLAETHKEIVTIDGTRKEKAVHNDIVAALLAGPLKKRHCAKSYGCDEPALCIDRKLGNCRWVNMCKAADLPTEMLVRISNSSL